MSAIQFVTFDFVEKERTYIMKFTEQGQTNATNKLAVSKKQDSKILYRNELNSISFPNFTAMEFNIFFTILYHISNYIKNKGVKNILRERTEEIENIISNTDENTGILKNDKRTDFIEIKFDDLKVFMPQIKNKKRFFNEIVNFAVFKLKYVGVDRTKILKNIDNEDKHLIDGSPFFENFFIDENREILGVRITFFAYSMINEFGNFMSFDMEEFCSFENKYTKSLFRLLKQYENSDSKQIIMDKNEFQKFINAPAKYDVVDLERKTIVPSVNEIKLKSKISNGVKKTYSFVNVDYEKIYNNDKKRVKGFKFVFEKRSDK